MDSSCIFCRIVAGEIPASVAYQDEDVLAFLDIHPVRPGHLLVIPRTHVPDLQDVDDALYSRLMLAVKRLMGAVKQATGAPRSGLLVMGFDVPHAHVHVIPLQTGADISPRSMLEGTTQNASPAELQEMAAKIASALGVESGS